MKSFSVKKAVAYLLQVSVISLACSQLVYSQEFIKPPDALIVEGVPKIPVSEGKRFDQHIRWRRSNFKGWRAKDGALIGIERRRLFYKSSFEGRREKVNTIIRNSDYIQFQPNGGSNFLYTITHPKTGNRLLFRYDTDSKKRFILTKPQEFDTIHSYEWSHDGEHIYFTNHNTKKGFSELFRLDLGTNKRELMATFKGDANYLTAANEKYIILINFFSNNHSVLSLFNLTNKELTPFTSKTGYVSELDFSKDGSGVWFLSNKNGGFFNLYFYDIEKQRTRKLNKFESNISGFALSSNEKVLALKVNINGTDGLRIFKMSGRGIGKELSGPQMPVGVIKRFSWRNDEEIGFDFESTVIPSEIKSYNIKTGVIKNWTKSEIGVGLVGKIENTKLIKWKSFDGREITGFLLEPKRTERNSKMAVIIDIHGGPYLQYRPKFNGYTTNLAAELSTVVISPNIRGSSGFGREFQDLDNKEKRGDAVRDLQALLDWIEKQPYLDSNKVFVRGTSYGGFMALALGLKEQDRIRGIIAYVPLVSIRDSQDFSEKSRQKRWEWEYGSVMDVKLMDQTERLSLLYPGNLKKWKIPIFLIAGQNDKNLSTASIDKLRNKLKVKGIPYWYIKAKNEGHGFARYSNYRFYSIASLIFLQTKDDEQK